MRVLRIDEPFKYQSDVFFIIRKYTPFFKLHERYEIIDLCNNFVTMAYIRSMNKLKMSDITNELALLDKNTSSDILKQILIQEKGIKETDTLVKVVLSTQRPILDYDR